jgi:4-diphosphocytidyl-2-C-methyl-D-erythritol kinase
VDRVIDGKAGAVEGKARAKINLELQVSDVRTDGFHNLETIFARIALHDSVTVSSIAAGIELVVHGDAGGANGASNLAHRAASLLRDTLGRSDGVRVELTKRIPTGAGLGGGSADAAATLQLVNMLWGHPLDTEALVELSATLGSDVPFLTSGYAAALGTGRGELLKEIELPSGPVVLLALPDVHVNTAEAYRSLDAYRREHGWLLSSELDPLVLWKNMGQFSVNNFELPVHEKFPELQTLHRSLGEVGALMARMSGSGAAHFAVFSELSDAEAALIRLGPDHPSVRFTITEFE